MSKNIKLRYLEIQDIRLTDISNLKVSLAYIFLNMISIKYHSKNEWPMKSIVCELIPHLAPDLEVADKQGIRKCVYKKCFPVVILFAQNKDF